MILIIFLFITFNLILISCNNVIDVDDILSIDYMPARLFVLENPESGVNYKNESYLYQNDTEEMSGKFNEAFSTMGYHR